MDKSSNRRHFLRRAAGLAAAATATEAQTGRTWMMSHSQVDAGDLSVGYFECGPSTGRPVMLLHGWPYDTHSYDEAAQLLAHAGFRVVVPYLRGFGTTRFLSGKTTRNGQQAALAADAIALLDALKINQAIFAGFDWGARTAAAVAALWPERCKALVSVSGYLIVNLQANQRPLLPASERGWWYQYYFATERGRAGYRENRNEFNRLIWKLASPKWNFDEATFNRTAESFQNSDHVDVVVHNYRWRLSLAEGEDRYNELEQKLQAGPTISSPAITIASDFDGASATGAAYRSKFVGRYAHRILKDIGHNVPHEAPHAFAQAIMDVAAF